MTEPDLREMTKQDLRDAAEYLTICAETMLRAGVDWQDVRYVEVCKLYTTARNRLLAGDYADGT